MRFQNISMMKKTILSLLLIALGLAACLSSQPTVQPAQPEPPQPTMLPIPSETASPVPTHTAVPTPTALPLVPNFSHIVVLIFENKEFGSVVGNNQMAYFNFLADTYTLLTQHYAVTHPSLPNYLALVGGDTFGILDNCIRFEECHINQPSLPDLIEQSGRTWKTYQDDMPEPCFEGETLRYVRKHNPFIFFDPIRLDPQRCARSIVPLTQLEADLASGQLPNFVFITPDICYSAHDCTMDYADEFIKQQVDKLFPVLEASGEPYLIILTWDEGQGEHSCCGLPALAGGRVATVLISPQVKQIYEDATPYTHYSILKTISESWSLPYLGQAADPQNVLITAPWR